MFHRFMVLAIAVASISSLSYAQELDQVLPQALLVRVDATGNATVFQAQKVAPQAAESALQNAIATSAVEANQIAAIQKIELTGKAELDQVSSTAAWYWYGYNSYWNSAYNWNGYNYSYNYGYNYGYSNNWFSYSGYNYNWNYSYYWNGYRWNWYWY